FSFVSFKRSARFAAAVTASFVTLVFIAPTARAEPRAYEKTPTQTPPAAGAQAPTAPPLEMKAPPPIQVSPEQRQEPRQTGPAPVKREQPCSPHPPSGRPRNFQ